MANFEKLRENLTREGFQSSFFPTAQEAVDYLAGELKGKTIGFGGSMSVRDSGLFDRLALENTCIWHWNKAENILPAEATNAPVYICSLNGVAETGELINIDGGGNRLASNLYGHEKIYFLVGRNKITPDYDSALWRARNIASPKNAQRLQVKTPCAVKGDKCYNCSSPGRICRALLVYWQKPSLAGDIELVLVDEDLGY